MKYDDSEYLFLNFETERDNDSAATHMGMYLGWAILRGLAGDHFSMPEAKAQIEQFKARQTTGREVFLDRCDGKLTADDFNAVGNAFTSAYYERTFTKDYERVFQQDFSQTGHPVDDFCSIPDTWESFDRLAPLLDHRFRQWQEASLKARGGGGQPPAAAGAKPTANNPPAAQSGGPLDGSAPKGQSGQASAHSAWTLEPITEPPPVVPEIPSLDTLEEQAEAGDRDAWYQLGIEHVTGERVPQDFRKAAEAFRHAADLGLVEGMFNLGVCYQNGDGVPKDGAQALHWFSQAAHGGHAEGLFMLAMAYRGTPLMPQDLGASNALMMMARMRGAAGAAREGIIAGSGGYVDLMKQLMEPGQLLPVLAERRRQQGQPEPMASATAASAPKTPSNAKTSPERAGIATRRTDTPLTAQPAPDLDMPGILATLAGASSMFILLLLATRLGGGTFRTLSIIFAVIGAVGVFRVSRWLRQNGVVTALMTLLALIPVLGSFVCILMLFWRFRKSPE